MTRCSSCRVLMLRVSTTAVICASVCFAPVAKGEPPTRKYRSALLLRDDAKPEPAGAPDAFGFLHRELYRQAFLLAARETTSDALQDAALDPIVSPQREKLILDLYLEGSGPAVKLWLGTTGHRPVLAQPVPAIEYDARGWAESLDMAERLSRSEFAAWIEGHWGKHSPSTKKRLTADALAGIDQQLSRLDVVTHFLCLHKLHGASLFEPETIESLERLVRTYAELGALLRRNWSPAHKAYSARALVYAQRLVQATPNRPQSHWNRAYAWALAGIQVLALADLAAAETARQVEEEPPDWLKAIDASLHYDLARLKALSSGEPPNRFATWFLMDILKAPGVDACTFHAAEQLLESAPTCLYALDNLHNVGGVGLHHRSSTAPWSIFFKFYAPRLARLKLLPEECRKPLVELQELTQDDGEPAADEEAWPKQVAAWGRFVDSLRHDELLRDATVEPSWNALGDLLQEATFLATMRRAHFLQKELSVDVGSFLEPAYEALRDHPCRPWLLAYSNNRVLRQNVLSTWLDKDRFLNWQHHQEEPWFAALEMKNDAHLTLYRRAQQNEDHGCVHEFEFFVDHARKPAYFKMLVPIAPYSPRYQDLCVRYDLAEANDNGVEWERRFGEHPMILGSLGRWHKKHERWADAKRCLADYLKLSPDFWAFIDLAECYEQEGDETKWRETLELALREPDLGLAHAHIRVKIADWLMDQGKFQEARPYAEAAAESYSHRSMKCAARCFEGLQDWEQAELWVARAAQRYRSTGLDWYDWCLRTQRGDRQSAHRLVAEAIDRETKSKSPDAQVTVAYYKLVEGDAKTALELYLRSFDQTHNPYAGIHAAVLLHEQGASDRRDDILRDVVNRGPEHQDNYVGTRTSLISAATVLLAALQADGKIAQAREKIDAIIEAADERDACNVRYFFGRLLEIDRDHVQAMQFFRDAAAGPPSNHCRILAAERLRELDQRKKSKQDLDA